MNKETKLLLEYQEIDKGVKAIEDEVLKSEEAIKYLTARKFLNSANETLTNINVKAEQLLSRQNSLYEEFNNLTKQATELAKSVDKCKKEEELASLKKKFDEIYNSINAKESELLSVRKEMEDLYKEFFKLANKRKEMKEQYDLNKPLYEAKKESKKGEINELKVKLDKIKVDIPENLMQKYNDRRKDNKFPILYKISNPMSQRNCPRCMTGLSTLTLTALSNGELQECDTCHTLIYAEE